MSLGFKGLRVCAIQGSFKMSRALRPLADRLLGSWSLSRLSIGASSRAWSSLPGPQNGVVGSPPVMQSPAWAGRMELPEENESAPDDMELMAVPKRKVTPSRRGKRNNGNWKLKSVPVICKCKVCGRIKLPHLYCCDGQVQS
ncbi:hypothetical protein M758_6G172000 [Ceratodon purpureus]|uniref:Large ribosomal subunit protein bL32m n=1 Tax=Ceratodon purpureus TaxID=3225 RepID=A0A8T0HGB1_CERPU|nr:hypothetical protein KC19_6G179000 [Ceratodon purpureus]KAG0614374.1 hypothetical protein M758_6G172000 [Ceratodon purpureus]